MPRRNSAPSTIAMIPSVRGPRRAITVREPLPEHGISPVLVDIVQETFAVPLMISLRFYNLASRSTVDLTELARLVICSSAVGSTSRLPGSASDTGAL